MREGGHPLEALGRMQGRPRDVAASLRRDPAGADQDRRPDGGVSEQTYRGFLRQSSLLTPPAKSLMRRAIAPATNTRTPQAMRQTVILSACAALIGTAANAQTKA